MSDKYRIDIFWSENDKGWIAVAPDLPGSSCIGDTRTLAAAAMDEVIEGWIEATVAARNPVPFPSRSPHDLGA